MILAPRNKNHRRPALVFDIVVLFNICIIKDTLRCIASSQYLVNIPVNIPVAQKYLFISYIAYSTSVQKKNKT